MGEPARNLDGTTIVADRIYSVIAAGAAVGLGETFMRREIREGRLVARRLGKRVLRIKGKDLQEWLDAWITTTEYMASCERPRDGSQSGGQENAIVERALASVTRA